MAELGKKIRGGFWETSKEGRTKEHRYLDIHLLIALLMTYGVLIALVLEAFEIVRQFPGIIEMTFLYLSSLMGYWIGKVLIKYFRPHITMVRNRFGEWAGFSVFPLMILMWYLHMFGLAPGFHPEKWLFVASGTGAIFTLTLVGNAFVNNLHEKQEQEKKAQEDALRKKGMQH